MRRLVLVATLVPALAVVPAVAQRGGIQGGSAGRAGSSGHSSFGGHVGSGASFGGMTGRLGFQSPGFHGPSLRSSGVHNPGFARRRGSQDHFLILSNRRFPGSRFRRFDFDRDDFRFRSGFRNCFGFKCGWGWGWPWWWGWDRWSWDSDSSYDQNEERDLELANEMNRQNLEEQRERRQEDQDLYARSNPQPQPRDAHADPPTPSTVLVFRDQHRQEIQNYAIVGTTMWAFAPQRTQKISLADLDIPATTKANDDRGVDFRLPGGEAQ